MAGVQELYCTSTVFEMLIEEGQPMFYEGFSANMKRELIQSEIGPCIPSIRLIRSTREDRRISRCTTRI